MVLGGEKMPNNETLGASFSIDVTKLRAGLAQANRMIRESESEFKAAAAGMDDWTQSQEGLEARIKYLNTSIDQHNSVIAKTTAEKEKVVKAMQEEGKTQDEINKVIDEANKILNKEYNALEKNKKELQNQKKALDDLGNATEESAKDMDELADSAKDTGDGFTIAKGAVAGFISNALSELVSSVKDAVESTKELNTAMSRLETGFTTAGFEAEDAKNTYKELYAVLGDGDRASEAAGHLSLLAETTEDLEKWVDIATGVYAQFGDSLPIEGLTEAANETAKVGDLTGVLADALNWAGINEEEFQAQLDACSTEQERQQVITETLNGLYSTQAERFRELNADVIESNKAQAELSETQADLGKSFQPIMTAIDQFKASVASRFSPAIESIAKGIDGIVKGSDDAGEDLIDGLKKATKEALSLFDDILDGFVDAFGTAGEFVLALTTALISFKAAISIGTFVSRLSSYISTLASNILAAAKATEAASAAQVIWNTALSANPIGLVATLVGTLAGVISLVALNSKDAQTETDKLSEKQMNAAEVANQLKESYDKLAESVQTDLTNHQANFDYIENNVIPQLSTLIDENGKVKEGYEARAEFLIGQMNEAYGTEYENISDIIDKNGELKESVYDVIEAKKAEILLSTFEEQYKTALENVDEAQKAVTESSLELSKEREALALLEKEFSENQALYTEEMKKSWADRDQNLLSSISRENAVLSAGIANSKKALEEKEAAYNESNSALQKYYSDIDTYEMASTALLAGETEKAISYMQSYTTGFQTATSTIGKSTEERAQILQDQVRDTEIAYQIMLAQYEADEQAMTDEQKKQAQARLDEAKRQAEQAKEEYAKLGENMVSGMSKGAEDNEWQLIGSLKSVVDSAVNAAKKALGINSPSKVMADLIGKNMALGVGVGFEDNMRDVNKKIEKSLNVEALGLNNNAAKSGKAALNTGVVVNQYNTFSQAHSRYEIFKSKQQTAAAVRLAMAGGV